MNEYERICDEMIEEDLKKLNKFSKIKDFVRFQKQGTIRKVLNGNLMKARYLLLMQLKMAYLTLHYFITLL